MIIIGHPDIPYEPFFYVESIEEIAQTPPNATLWLGPWSKAKAIAKHCHTHQLPFAILVQNRSEAALANALGAAYLLVVDEGPAQAIQKMADHYLFDTKILMPIHSQEQIGMVAEWGIDGVIFQAAIRQAGSS